MSNDNISLIILAGGKGKRLGQEKAWVKFEGQTLLERSISRLGSLVSQVIVVRAPGQELPVDCVSGRLTVVDDLYLGKGPLVGIYSGLRVCAGGGGFVVACDMPFVNPGFVRYIIDLSPGFDVVIPRFGELLEPLHAFYSVRCIETIGEMIESGHTKARDLLKKVKVKYVEKDEILRLDPEKTSYFNINTKIDLNKAELIATSLPKIN